MSHRIAVYKIRVRPQRETEAWKPFGDVDGAGTWLGEPVSRVLAQLKVTSRDGKVEARAGEALADLAQHQVGWTVVSGKSGIASRIEKDGEAPFRRTPAHIEAMRSAVLFNLPRASTTGYVAIHIPHRHGCKAVLEDTLRAALRDDGLTLEIAPVVPQDALLQAVRANGIDEVTLVKYEPLGTDAFEDVAMWGGEKVGKVKLTIPRKRGRRLSGDEVLRFLEDPTEERRRRLVVFEGLNFDAVSVKVPLQGGASRTFYLERLESGHPMTVAADIGPADTDELGATPEVLSRELRSTLGHIAASPVTPHL